MYNDLDEQCNLPCAFILNRERNASRIFAGNLLGNIHFKRSEIECRDFVGNGCPSVGFSSFVVRSFELFCEYLISKHKIYSEKPRESVKISRNNAQLEE